MNRTARARETTESTTQNGFERPLPQNVEAERVILGAILVDDAAINPATNRLKPEDFFHDHHRRIYQQMIALGESAQAIDLVTLTEQLRRTGDLESVGGVAYVSQLIDGVPRITNVEHYARIVKEKSLLRGLIHATGAIQQQAFDAEEDADEVLDRASISIASIGRLNGLQGEPRAWREMFHSFAEFEAAPMLTFAIKGILQNDGATLIGGLSGHGKTLIMLSLAKALLAGEGTKLWGEFEVMETAVRVVYLIPESPIGPFKHRLQLFGLYDSLRPDDNRLLVHTLSKGPTPCLSDPRVLFAAKGAHVFLDTAVRFSTEGDENSAGDNQRGLATDIFALLRAGARTVTGAHHSPKPFARENMMRLENVLRGSGDIGAMLATAWGIKQLDRDQNIVHIENIKPRDFQPPAPFQIIGRPYIDETGDFRMLKRPGECGALMDEQEPERDHGGGAPQAARDARAANLALMRGWLQENPGLTSTEVMRRFLNEGIKVGDSAIRKYRKELRA